MTTFRPPFIRTSIVAGILAAVGATSCCLLPLLLVGVGLGGAWIATARSLEVLQLPFAVICVLSLGYAFFRLYLRPPVCSPGQECELPRVQRVQRAVFWTALGAIVLLGVAYAFVPYLE
jgi:mercuric ion transport protein